MVGMRGSKDCKRVMPSDTSSGKAFVFGKNFVANGADMLKIKRDIVSETDFVSPDDTAQGKAWDSMGNGCSRAKGSGLHL